MKQKKKVRFRRQRKPTALKAAVFGFLAITTVFFVACLKDLKFYTLAQDKGDVNPDFTRFAPRVLLWHPANSNEVELNKTPRDNTSKPHNNASCISPSVKEFPRDLFSFSQLKHGAVILHIFASTYMFLALAFVCDDYFVASLDCICENLHLSDDIAGATFMAAGSSAPELFTSLFGLFVTHGDVGTGAIVGSAVFNILVILALVSILSGQETRLTRWPLCRDSFAYTISILALIGVMNNGYIEWYESLILLILYIFYLILMKFNSKIHKPATDIINEDIESTNQSSIRADEEGVDPKLGQDAIYRMGGSDSYNLVPKKFRRLTWKEVGMMIMLDSQFPPATRFRAACYMVTLRQDTESSSLMQNISNDNEANAVPEKGAEDFSSSKENSHVADIEMELGPFTSRSNSVLAILFRVISKPIVLLLRYTIPDCKVERWQRWYMATFLMSIFWIAVFSYVMVWMVTVVGFTLGIPDVIMGITFLAAGTSIPDAIASLIVSRQGQGDMAVSNSIGSNVFDILIGLAFPWFLETTIINPGSKVKVNSRGLKYSVILLLGSVVITVATIHFNKWKLNRKTGYIFVIVYLIFVSFSCLIEFNVFGFVNLPVCSFTW